MKAIYAYTIALGSVATVASLGRLAMKDGATSEWYQSVKPRISPPNIVYPIVWSLLYVLIAIVLANTIMMDPSRTRSAILVAFAIDLSLQIVWSWLFFGLRKPKMAMLVMIMILVSSMSLSVLVFREHKGLLQYALVPYVAWLCFAAVLNLEAGFFSGQTVVKE